MKAIYCSCSPALAPVACFPCTVAETDNNFNENSNEGHNATDGRNDFEQMRSAR